IDGRTNSRAFIHSARILLEYVDGYGLNDLPSLKSEIPTNLWPKIADEVVDLIITIGKMGVLNRDVGPRNMLIQKSDFKVVQIEFCMCEFREDFDAYEWKRRKCREDEEGNLGIWMQEIIEEHVGKALWVDRPSDT
ncbi:MAG: hypothetical protein MMC33_007429, partial [Icmadophila ericetorum]|nr:hypothetical protein [Icmadophila ericetorum]